MSAAIALSACASGPRVAPISVRYLGVAGLPPVSPASVEIVRAKELRPHSALAQLEVASDGSSFESLVLRLRDRAAALGADALVDVTAVYDVPATGSPQVSSNPTDGNLSGEAARAGLTLLLSRPSWVAVRGIAVRLDERHAGEQPFRVRVEGDGSQSPVQQAQGLEPPENIAERPLEKPPVEKKP